MFFGIISRGFHLNKKINPNKLILIYQEHKSQISDALAERICTELRESHLNAHPTDAIIHSTHVSYNIVITDRTLTDGVLKLVHFKPRVCEEVHVSEILQRLLPYENIS